MDHLREGALRNKIGAARCVGIKDLSCELWGKSQSQFDLLEVGAQTHLARSEGVKPAAGAARCVQLDTGVHLIPFMTSVSSACRGPMQLLAR